jgi:hypothetical protein
VADGRGLVVSSVDEDGDPLIQDGGDPQEIAVARVAGAGLDVLEDAAVDAGGCGT